jgi:hypothetical protein
MSIEVTSGAQERLFNPDRFSPVHPEVVLRLPEGSTRTFWLASMLGSYLKWEAPGGGFRVQRKPQERWLAGGLLSAFVRSRTSPSAGGSN